MPEYITSAEFTRYTQSQREFHAEVRQDLTEIKQLVRSTNGRVNKAEMALEVLAREVEAVKSEDVAIGDIVNSIKDEGCSQYAQHIQVLNAGGIPAVAAGIVPFRMNEWTRRQKVIGGAGVAIVMWPALQEVAKLGVAIVKWIEGWR